MHFGALDWLVARPIAHRGLWGPDAPENSLSAMKLAWQQGADGIETDLHLSKDGRLVVLHDADTKRLGGVTNKIATRTWDELKGMDIGSWKGQAWAGEKIPTLDSILALSDDPGSRYHGLIDGERIGIGGRSLGGATSLLTVYNTRHGDPRVRAVFSAAGLELPVEGGAFEYEGRPPAPRRAR